LDWKHVLGLGLTPLIALKGIMTVELQTKTLIWAIIYYFATGFGITAGKRTTGRLLFLSASFLPLKFYIITPFKFESILFNQDITAFGPIVPITPARL